MSWLARIRARRTYCTPRTFRTFRAAELALEGLPAFYFAYRCGTCRKVHTTALEAR